MKIITDKIEKINIEKIILIFFFLQPFLDIYMCYTKEPIQILGMSINIFINFLFVFVMSIYSIYYVSKTKPQKLKRNIFCLAVYLLIFFVYSLLHYNNMTNFDLSIIKRNTYNYIQETYYMFRVFVLPLLLVYVLYNSGLTKKKIVKIVKLSTLIITSVIIITNVLGVSLAAYSEENEYIAGTIFDWFSFNGTENFDLYTSKGLFNSGNELSAILFMFSPIIIREAIKRNKFKDYLLVLMLVISMMMLGTKTATMGIILILILMLLSLWLFGIIKKKREKIIPNSLKLFSIIAFSIFLFFYSPMYNRNYGEFKVVVKERPTEEKLEDVLEEDTELTLVEFIEKYSWNYYIDNQIFNVYPVENDLEFWLGRLNVDVRLNSDNRVIRTDIFNRIIERNNNPLDKLLGIGYSDTLYNEKDILFQYYTFGIVGLMLFMGPYFLILLYALYQIFSHPQKLFSYECVTYIMSLGIILTVPYVTGHVYGVPFSMVYISLIAALLLRKVEIKK